MSEESPPVRGEFPAAVSDPAVFRRIEREMIEWIGDDSSGHDLDHAHRVFDLGVRIAEAEGADVDVVGAAALTHDVHRAMGDDEYVPPADSLPEVRSILEAAGFPSAEIPAVLHCVAVHEAYEFRDGENPAETTAALVVQDADNVDAIGAVGIARNFAFTGVAGNRLWAPRTDEPSGLDHLEEKLLELRDEMNTDEGRRLAEDRHAFLVGFRDRFVDEWTGAR